MLELSCCISAILTLTLTLQGAAGACEGPGLGDRRAKPGLGQVRSSNLHLHHVSDFLLNLPLQSMHAGMIVRISEENQKLPLANRLAYRRFIMEVNA